MPNPLRWNEHRDDTIRALRHAGASWDSIAARLGIGRWATIERARLIGAWHPVPKRAAAPDPFDAPERPPLEAGHPQAWAILTAGTMLHATRYPTAAERAAMDRAEEHAEAAEHRYALRTAARAALAALTASTLNQPIEEHQPASLLLEHAA